MLWEKLIEQNILIFFCIFLQKLCFLAKVNQQQLIRLLHFFYNHFRPTGAPANRKGPVQGFPRPGHADKKAQRKDRASDDALRRLARAEQREKEEKIASRGHQKQRGIQ